ncbi:hypothetical protein [Psychroserpens sp.]|uniref:hypothetical protein n=1 Tax=Psychroserpens sp. TaxID=2020870 RepID=UPI003C707B0E
MKKIVTACIFIVLMSLGASSQDKIIAVVSIEGNDRTRTNFLKRLAFVKEGAILDSVRIASDVRRFKLLPAVASADYKINNLGDGEFEIIYTIVENFAIIPGLNISNAPNGDFAFRTSIFDFNFLGRNQIIGGFYSRNVFDSFGVYWEAPNLLTRKLGIGLNYQNNVLLEPVFFDNDATVNYKFNTRAVEIKMQYEHNFHNRFELGLNISAQEYDFDNGDEPLEAPLSLGIDTVAVIGEYEYNGINIDYQYQSGFRSILSYNVLLGSNGDNDLLRNAFIGRNDFEYFKRVGERGNWANRLSVAYASNSTTPFAALIVDNQLNIRGVGNSVDRGSAAVVFNTEYRYTLYEKGWFVLQSNVFVDTGIWQDPGGNLGDLVSASNNRVYPGGGIRFIHKRIFNAVFRLDYGIGLGDNATSGIVFGIGQYF